MLIYIASLTLQLAIDINIYNQCTNIELTSPVHFLKDATYHIQFPQKVRPDFIMKGRLIISEDRDTFGGALLYRLQRKESTSICAQFLVIWGCRSDWLYSHALIIEHESKLVWNEDKLRRLYDVYNSRCNRYFDTGKWLLDDSTMLNICQPSCEDLEIEVSISEKEEKEENYLFYPLKPLWVDPNR
jgi:hypothetical protein